MNDYTTRSGRIARWYLTEWEQVEQLEYRRRLHLLALSAGALGGVVWSFSLLKILGL